MNSKFFLIFAYLCYISFVIVSCSDNDDEKIINEESELEEVELEDVYVYATIDGIYKEFNTLEITRYFSNNEFLLGVIATINNNPNEKITFSISEGHIGEYYPHPYHQALYSPIIKHFSYQLNGRWYSGYYGNMENNTIINNGTHVKGSFNTKVGYETFDPYTNIYTEYILLIEDGLYNFYY